MNETQLAILQGGGKAWNKWRTKNPTERPDLTEANLTGAHLTGANLSEAKLTGANLTGAKLTGAHLTGANLSKAKLFEANLTGAYLTGAYLLETNLSGAHLTGAILTGAILTQADLSGTDLSGAYLSGAHLSGAHLTGAHLTKANLSGADLTEADLSGANLSKAKLFEANLSGANLSGADLSGADLSGANLTRANLSEANLSEAILYGAMLVNTDLTKANLTRCYVYGLSVWGVQLNGAVQTNLKITPPDEPEITVDNLEVAQFIYLLLNNNKIRQVIDTITSKVVLILGRFTPERKAVLDAIREELRKCDLLPILFDFDKPSSRDTHETITTLARMARFIIADITEAKSIPQELVSIVEQLPSLPVQPILHHGGEPWGMFDHIKRYPWVLGVKEYEELEDLLPCLNKTVIAPAEAKVKKLRARSRRSVSAYARNRS